MSGYRPQTKLRKGNVFRSVCHSVHWGGGACMAGEGGAWMGGMHGWGHVWLGACMAGECVRMGVHAAGNAPPPLTYSWRVRGKHPTGMRTSIDIRINKCMYC